MYALSNKSPINNAIHKICLLVNAECFSHQLTQRSVTLNIGNMFFLHND